MATKQRVISDIYVYNGSNGLLSLGRYSFAPEVFETLCQDFLEQKKNKLGRYQAVRTHGPVEDERVTLILRIESIALLA